MRLAMPVSSLNVTTCLARRKEGVVDQGFRKRRRAAKVLEPLKRFGLQRVPAAKCGNR